jgi:hypothetical protein
VLFKKGNSGTYEYELGRECLMRFSGSFFDMYG